jgi:DNA processing protein
MLPDQENTLLHRLALTFIKDIGPRRASVLLNHFGNVEHIFKASAKELKHADGLGETLARSFKEQVPDAFQKAEEELHFIIKHDIQTLWIEDEHYPQRLKNCLDAPVLLFYKGNGSLNAKRNVAIIGTRKYTDYGQRLCEELVEGLKGEEDMMILSGLAHGIDTIAHKAALKQGLPTIGVLGHGLDRIYPATNKNLAKEMLEQGGLLAEFPSGTLPDRSNFPMRNRIVAGVSDVTVVVESDISGGALITARIASSYNRDVAAFPGRVHDNKSSGCNELIRTNVAAMITKADDLLELMGWQKSKKNKAVQKQLFLNLSAEEQTIINILQTKDSVHADELLHLSDMSNSLLAGTLLQLEMQGLIKALPGKFYRTN